MIVDIDHDFSAEIVLASNDMWEPGWAGITVLGAREQSWYPARGIWNQHAYYIDNIADDGSIPTNPDLPWESHNSFRRNTVFDESVLWAPNLVPYGVEECFDLCPDQYVLLVSVANEGLADVGAGTAVSAFLLPSGGGSELLTTEYLDEEIPSGMVSSEVAVILDAATVGGQDLRIAVDVLESLPEGLNAECHEDDNDRLLSAVGCGE